MLRTLPLFEERQEPKGNRSLKPALQSCMIAAIAEPIIMTASTMPMIALFTRPLPFRFFSLPGFAITFTSVPLLFIKLDRSEDTARWNALQFSNG
jgi:hypothetical protein